MNGKLYVVGTPIGNMKDITLRALEVFRFVDAILCEDKRVTKKLLEHHGIEDKDLLIYNEKPSGLRAEKVIELLRSGKNIALVTDAGTPGVSDPGNVLVQKINEEEDLEVVSVPGPSALTAALSISGIHFEKMIFLGFLPSKKGRQTALSEMAQKNKEDLYVFYESTHRIIKLLEELSTEDFKDKKIFIGRELTKKFEETFYGDIEKALGYFTQNDEKTLGEFVVMLK